MEMRCKTSPNTDIGIQQPDDPYGELDRVAHRDGAGRMRNDQFIAILGYSL